MALPQLDPIKAPLLPTTLHDSYGGEGNNDLCKGVCNEINSDH